MDKLIACVIHSLEKKAGAADVSIVERDEPLDASKPPVLALFTQLADLVGKPGNSVLWGQFRTDKHEGEFPDAARKVAEKPVTATFMDASRTAMAELARNAEEENFATGGYVCFALYLSGGSTFLLVAMIKERAALTLNEKFEPTEITEVDLSKLHQAARVNLDRLSTATAADAVAAEDDDDRTYLCFVNKKTASEVAVYFITALGCAKGVASSRMTKRLMKAVQTYVRGVPEVASHARTVRASVVDYLFSLDDGSVVSLDTIVAAAKKAVDASEAHRLDGLKEFLNSEEVGVPDEFPVNKRTLRGYVQITDKAGNGNWRFAVEVSALGTSEAEVVYDMKDKSLTFRNLSAEARKKIEEALAARASDK